MKQSILEELVARYPALIQCRADIEAAYRLLQKTYDRDGILYLCGNGGSAADAGHIVGELMKSFTIPRPISDSASSELNDPALARQLHGVLRAISLSGHLSLSTAFGNDVDADYIFAQQIFGYGRPGDVLWALSTSGNSPNILHALKVAKARGLATLGLTGEGGGEMKRLCQVCIRVPERETYKVQELHLPVYHALCRMLEENFFPQSGNL